MRVTNHNKFLLVFLATLSIFLVYAFTSNGWLTFIVFVTNAIIVLIAYSPWNGNSVHNIGSKRIQVALTSVIAIFIFTLASSQPQSKSVINFVLSKIVPYYKDTLVEKNTLSDETSILVFIFAVIAIVFINYFCFKDATAMREHPIPIDEAFPEQIYRGKFRSFCNFLNEDLRRIDKETDWSMEYFTHLDAEVEVQSGLKRLKKVTDLLTAIKADRLSRVFLVLGDPGSGKSVSLRKLSRELLQESEETGKVPLYINLREWETQQEWTKDNPPTVEELYQFVVNNLKARGDICVDEFIKMYFKKMFDHGRLFIVLDSFDEIPAVMDVSENSWLIDKLSDVIHSFLAGANESRGILASRIFRRPSDKFDAKTILEIRPFTEDKVIETLKKSLSYSLSYDDKLVELIFKERQEFVPVARNPFTAALISSYAKKYDNSLPQNQAELYSSYIDQRLDACRDRIQRKNLTKKQIIQCAIDIADTMMTTETYGLEASVQELKVKLPQHPIEDVIDILKYARLGRLGSGDENRFSFVHRRFNEYFVVQRLIEQPHRVPQDAIPNDSRWRDALVLYCEVAEENKAKEIANFCWSEISQVIDNNVDMRDPRFLRMIHCLRFLKDAFRTRTNYIEDFLPKLTLFIKDQIKNQKNDFYLLAIAKLLHHQLLHRAYFRLLGFHFHTLIKKPQENLLLQKFAVEAVGLLKNEDIDKVIIKALSLNNDWISETALRSCRHLPKITDKLENRLIVYIANLPAIELIKQQKDLRFSLKLSDAFSKVEKSLTLTICNHYFSLVSLILSFSLIPHFISTGFLYHWIIIFLSLDLDYKHNLSKNNLIIVEKDIFMGYLRLFIPATMTYLMIFIFLTVNEYNKLYYLSPLAFLLTQNLQLVGIMFLILTLFMIPYYQITAQVREFMFLTNRKEKIRIVLNFLCTVFIIVVAAYLFHWMSLNAKIDTNLTILIIAFFCILFAPFILIELLKICKSYIQDYREMNNNEENYESREDISNHFKKYKTTWGRSRYVVFLQIRNIKPVGNWPDGQLPNVNNDLPSTLLAKLEEKWLGLDR